MLTFSSLCSFEKSRIPRSIGELERRIFWIFEKFSFKMTLLSVIRREEEDRFKHRCVSAVAVLSVHSAGRCQLLKGRNKVVVYKRRSGYNLLAADVQIDWGSTLQICQHNKGMLCAVLVRCCSGLLPPSDQGRCQTHSCWSLCRSNGPGWRVTSNQALLTVSGSGASAMQCTLPQP